MRLRLIHSGKAFFGLNIDICIARKIRCTCTSTETPSPLETPLMLSHNILDRDYSRETGDLDPTATNGRARTHPTHDNLDKACENAATYSSASLSKKKYAKTYLGQSPYTYLPSKRSGSRRGSEYERVYYHLRSSMKQLVLSDMRRLIRSTPQGGA